MYFIIAFVVFTKVCNFFRTFHFFVVAPWTLVGTRGDSIKKPSEHGDISNILENAFGSHPAWPFLVENREGQGSNGVTTLNFFPVDNTISV